MGCPGPEEVDEGYARGGTGLFVDRSDVAIERGARKEECRRHVLHAVVRNDQCLQNIALALGEPKGGNEAIEPIVKSKPPLKGVVCS